MLEVPFLTYFVDSEVSHSKNPERFLVSIESLELNVLFYSILSRAVLEPFYSSDHSVHITDKSSTVVGVISE